MPNNTRIVSGTICSWWGTIEEASRNTDGLPHCPYCSLPLFEFETSRAWWQMVHHYDASHPGYNQFIGWLEGKCFPSIKDARDAYEQATGRKVAL